MPLQVSLAVLLAVFCVLVGAYTVNELRAQRKDRKRRQEERRAAVTIPAPGQQRELRLEDRCRLSSAKSDLLDGRPSATVFCFAAESALHEAGRSKAAAIVAVLSNDLLPDSELGPTFERLLRVKEAADQAYAAQLLEDANEQ